MLRTITRAAPFALALFALTLMAVALHLEPPPTHSNPLFQGASIHEATLSLFQRSCQNCHSDNIRLPWYSRIPPASWIVSNDIDNALRRVNFSHWDSYTANEQEKFLTRIGAAVRTGRMPLPRYTFLHREAVLAPQERRQIYEWSRAEKKRLQASGAETSSPSVGPPSTTTSQVAPLGNRH